MTAPRKILFLTGTRADFGKLKPLIREVAAAKSEFEYTIFVTGMHLLARYGSTVVEVKKAGFENIFSYFNQDATTSSQMDSVLASTVQGLGHYVREFRPDLIVVHGDRVEALAGAIVGALNNVLVAHIEGGELSGTVDELLRHAVSKLSHLHFVANEEAKTRLVQMGERPETVFVVGSPDIDVMLSDTLPSLGEVKKKYDIAFSSYGIFIYHPVTTELAKLRTHIEAVMAGLKASRRKFVVLYPNNDSGSDTIMEAIATLEQDENFRVLPSLRFEYFLTLLKHTDVIVGNSSAGIREAPVYGVPTINLGTRQANRFVHQSIVNVAERKEAIVEALRELPARGQTSRHFGDGNSASQFIALLRRADLWRTAPQKMFRDIRQ